MKRSGLLATAALALVMSTGSASAVVTYTLSNTFSGDDPSAAPTVSFETTGTDEVTLTMGASSLTGDFEFLPEWYFNMDDPSVDLGFTHLSGPQATLISQADNAFRADGDGFFDILFQFQTAAGDGRFEAGETSIYTLMGTGIDENFFDVLAEPGPGGTPGPFHAAAKVQGIGPTGAGSGWVGDGAAPPPPPPPTEVPAPGTLSLLAAGLLALGVRRRWR